MFGGERSAVVSEWIRISACAPTHAKEPSAHGSKNKKKQVDTSTPRRQTLVASAAVAAVASGPKTHMLDSVGHAWHVILVAKVAHVDVHGGASLVRVGIVDEQNLQLVLQPDDAVVPVVQRRDLEAVRDPLDRPEPGVHVRGRGLHVGMSRQATGGAHDGCKARAVLRGATRGAMLCESNGKERTRGGEDGQGPGANAMSESMC